MGNELIPGLEIVFPHDDGTRVTLGIAWGKTTPPRGLHGTGSQHLAMFAKQRVQRHDITVDDRLLRQLPYPVRRALIGHRFDVLGERWESSNGSSNAGMSADECDIARSFTNDADAVSVLIED